MQGSVTVHMRASPDRIWKLVSDPTRIGRYSPEMFEGEWLEGATEPAPGARFRGHVRRNGRGPTYWTTCTVIACKRGREFGFAVGQSERPMVAWRYELTPAGDGTDVRESFALVPSPLTRVYWALAGWARGLTNGRNVLETLAPVKAEVEQPEAEADPVD